MQAIPMCKVKDLKNEEIKGLFYEFELQEVEKDNNSLWYIEAILKKRKLKSGEVQYFVKWDGFNSWVAYADVKDNSDNRL